MPWYCDFGCGPIEIRRGSHARAVGKGKGRGFTKPPLRKHRKRR